MRDLEQTARGIYTAMQSIHHTGANEGQSHCRLSSVSKDLHLYKPFEPLVAIMDLQISPIFPRNISQWDINVRVSEGSSP